VATFSHTAQTAAAAAAAAAATAEAEDTQAAQTPDKETKDCVWYLENLEIVPAEALEDVQF